MRDLFFHAFNALPPLPRILITAIVINFALQQSMLFGESVGKAIFHLTH